jgi:hypothetical protein
MASVECFPSSDQRHLMTETGAWGQSQHDQIPPCPSIDRKDFFFEKSSKKLLLIATGWRSLK